MPLDVDIAHIVVDNNSIYTDKIFDYLIPVHLKEFVKKGMRVIIPFGSTNRKVEGYVLNIAHDEQSTYKLKEIIGIVDPIPILSENQIKMIFWMKNKYLCKYLEAIHCIVPSTIVYKEKKIICLIDENWKLSNLISSTKQKEILEIIENEGGKVYLNRLKKLLNQSDIENTLKLLVKKNLIEIKKDFSNKVNIKKETYVKLLIEDELINQEIITLKNAKKQKEILIYLSKYKQCKLNEILNQFSTKRSTVKALEERGYVQIIDVEIKRDPLSGMNFEPFPKLKPSEEQQNAINIISESIERQSPDSYLIHGITGSGKTEIYLQLISKVIEKGMQSIIMVPEIALTPQTIERFYGRFGDNIAVLHSKLSIGERYDEWRKIVEGKVDIIIGARSAIFAPAKKLGIIIIDEEHEYTYKSDQNLKYHAIEVASYRSQLENAVLVLGSATPSLETYYKTQQIDLYDKKNKIQLISLTKRAKNLKLPKIEIVDMRKELNDGNSGIFSKALIHEINENLNNKNQSIIFLNRRGYATFISCRQCGFVLKCGNCDISMTFHLSDKIIKCHYCGETKEMPKICPICSSKYIKYFGAGTQKIEKLIQSLFPKAKLGRMDVDSTSKKGAHQKILQDFKNGGIDILIGTQMISKGLDFPNVTLVGIIAIDATLNLPDFRASEKTFQLITQVAGRAGRGDTEGRVILQTYSPQHYSIIASYKHDYLRFYNEEIQIRKEFSYPPFFKFIALNFMGEQEETLVKTTENIVQNIKYVLKSKGYQNTEDIVLGPNIAPIHKINNKYRYQILLKDVDVDISILKGIVKYFCIDHIEKYIPQNINVGIDINPFFMM